MCIPYATDGDLVTDAKERLSQAAVVDDVLIAKLHSIEARLSATVITVKIALRWTATVPPRGD